MLRENRDFRRFWTGETVSLFGDQITQLAIPLVGVLILHAGAAQMGYLTAANLAPYLLFSLHGGAWVDRRSRRRLVMIAADAGRAVLLASVPVAYALGALTIAQLYVVAFLTGTLSMLFFVSQTALFVALVRREQYVEASSLLNGSRAFSYVAGPSVAGGLVQILTAPYALVADACSFVVSAFYLARIDPVEPPPSGDEPGQVLAGARFIRSSPTMRSALGATATINFFNFAFFALFVLYATRYLHVRPGLLGLVLGAGAIGGLIGAAVTGRIGRRIGIGPAFVLGCVLFPVPIMLVPLAGGPQPLVLAMLFLAEFGSGLGVMILDISGNAIFAAVVPDRLRARVSGAYLVVNYGVRPLGALFGGALGSAIGVRSTLWVATAGAVVGFLWLLPSPLPRLRELPEEPEAV
ncbi:MAG TPA: MFS transporter [Gaiellaceae bacterium]|nr:MFS transporter [Gaiellaceae bacterium]